MGVTMSRSASAAILLATKFRAITDLRETDALKLEVF
jgi:hypothetical protein